MKEILSLLFKLEGRVDRKTYLIAGFGLMFGKYLIDSLVIFFLYDIYWSPIDYLSPFISMDSGFIYTLRPSQTFYIFFLIWTLPFIWIGVNLMMKRLLDAGKSPWYALFFFAPILNYLVMLALTMPESAQIITEKTQSESKELTNSISNALYGILAGIVIAAIAFVCSIYLFDIYSTTLFISTPFFVGITASYFLNKDGLVGQGKSFSHTMFTLALASGTAILFAAEGFVCILLSAPIALTVGGLGSFFGYHVARLRANRQQLLVLFPLLLLFGLSADKLFTNNSTMSITTQIEIEASKEIVWDEFIDFKTIEDEPSGFFKLGLAYPISARIEGEGVGAIRYCEFSTGDFVEPITTWDYPNLIQFDVLEQPQPLQEWSPYGKIVTPHLDNYFRSIKGEFKLETLPNGNTVIIGTTWYKNEMYPALYWKVIADKILSDIHLRVLKQIKTQSEIRSKTEN
ncbi:MAG: DUF805 domain-containing protein [Balneola sp.]